MSNRSITLRQVFVVSALFATLAMSELLSQTTDVCPDGTLFEPYSQNCAPVNDRRAWWLTPSESAAAALAEMAPSLDVIRQKSAVSALTKPWDRADEPPEPGAINAGTTYLNGALSPTTSAWLHTRIFVQPYGLNPSDYLGWTFMPATNHVDSSVEVVAIYRTALGDSGVLSIFGRPCSVDYPCPDGDTANGWQPSKDLRELGCNVTHFVDDGGHAQKIVHYANTSDRLDDGDPPLWRNAVYLWNYCASEWDLIWRHEYRENKRNCAVEGCYWWGPGLELSGDPFPRPQIAEIGYEDTLLYHDGVWSELRPDETGFRNPEDRPDLSPWLLFHLDPNRSFGAGNRADTNDPPVIESQATLSTPEDEPLAIDTSAIVVSDPDVDPAFHVSFALTLFDGDNYTQADHVVTPAPDYAGTLTVPIMVSDGAAYSATFDLLIEVMPVNDAPEIHLNGESVIMLDGNAVFVDPGATANDVEDGDLSDNIIVGGDTIDTNAEGTYVITYNVTDSGGLAAVEVVRTVVVEIDEPPAIILMGPSTLVLTVGDTYNEQGATAQDPEDGDLTDEITIINPVDTRTPDTYTVIYTVADSAGNEAQAERTVIVEEAPPPPKRKSGGSGAVSPFELTAFLLILLASGARQRE